MRRVFAILLLSLFTLRVFAQSVPVTPMQNAISGVIQQRMVQRGFAANDPRWATTLQSTGSTIAGVAASAAIVTAAGISAPAWVTAAITVGLGTLLATGIQLAINGVKWLLNGDGSVTVTPNGVSAPQALTQGSGYWSSSNFYWGIGSTPALAVIAASGDAFLNAGGQVVKCDMNSSNTAATCTIWDGSSHYSDGSPYYQTGSWNPIWNASGSPCTSSTGSCRGANAFTPPASSQPGGATKKNSVADAAASVSTSDAAMPLNPAIVAQLADTAWKQAAAQPGYAGVPYDVTNPITTADATAWQVANSSAWPTVGNLMTPQPAPSGGTASSPWQLPNSATPVTSQPATPTTTTTNPGTGSQVNLGPDPNIGAPTLETTPTAQMILQPILNLFPSLRNFVVPSHGGDCPKPSADIFGKHVQMDGHCTLLEPVRGTLSAVMAFVWVMIALLIILAA